MRNSDFLSLLSDHYIQFLFVLHISTNIFFAVLMANKCKKNQSVQSEVNKYGKVYYLYFNRTKRIPLEYQIWD
ncbi:hypothetical protein HanXRQr2_Chr11g0505501 [Helianthus annuus]|uniref:Uncharacterized protein n=2 Tax=Helianthus annuus TaxID=4232 RepID=A0A9K3HR68_HELAN|nr:hypothetical protein HanXRQr2_Chr11g0505501 [Helianthus annuus]